MADEELDDPNETKLLGPSCPMSLGGSFEEESYSQNGMLARSTFFGDTGAIPARFFISPGVKRCTMCDHRGNYTGIRGNKIGTAVEMRKDKCDKYFEWKSKCIVRTARFED